MSWLAGLCGHDDPPADDKLPPRPLILPPSRSDIWHAYFGSSDSQVAETADHVSMLFAAWGTDWQLAARIEAAGMPAILDVGDCLFTAELPRKYRGDEEARGLLRNRFSAFTDTVLHLIAALYVIDEPERESDVSAGDLELACRLLRSECLLIGINPKLHICYGNGEDYRGSEFVDWIGVDAYQDSPEQYRDRLSRVPLKSGQKLVAYVGGADPWKTDPRDVYLLAQQNLDIIGICSFLHLDYTGGKGIGTNGMADKYREMGKAVLTGVGS